MRVVVIGGGLAGCCAAEAILEAAPRGVPPEVIVLESTTRGIASIETETIEGNRIEHGLAAFDAEEPRAHALCQRLGLAPIAADPLASELEFYRQHRRSRIPKHDWRLPVAGVLPIFAGVRVAMAGRAAHRASTHSATESLDAFATRRFGRGAAALWMQALARSRFAGDAQQLELASALPALAERVSRQQVLPSIARISAAPASGHSFKLGMQELSSALLRRLGPRVTTSAAVYELTPLAAGWRLSTRRGNERADRVVLATPADETIRLLSGFDGDAATSLQSLRSAPYLTVTLGYHDAPGLRERTRNAGCLIAPHQGVRALDLTVPSTIFPQHATPGWIVLRLHYGGVFDTEIDSLDDDALQQLAREDIHRIYGIDPTPRFLRIARRSEGMPQFAEQAGARSTAMIALHERWPQLSLCGSAWHGVGVNTAIRAAQDVIPNRA